MEQMENEDFDSFLLQMEHKFNGIGEKEERGTEEKDFGMGFQMWLPEEFKEGDKEEAADIFWSEERPPVLFLTSDRRAGLMFRQLDGSAGASACRERSGMSYGGQMKGRYSIAAGRLESREIYYGWSIRVLPQMKGCIILPFCSWQGKNAFSVFFTAYLRIMKNGNRWFLKCLTQ